MTWNPWKKIKELREEIKIKDAVLEMRLADWEAASALATENQKRIFEIAEERDNARKDNKWYLNNMREIAAQENPTSSAAVKRICEIAQHVLDIHLEFEKNKAQRAVEQ
jgi:hypothetical protein